MISPTPNNIYSVKIKGSHIEQCTDSNMIYHWYSKACSHSRLGSIATSFRKRKHVRSMDSNNGTHSVGEKAEVIRRLCVQSQMETCQVKTSLSTDIHIRLLWSTDSTGRHRTWLTLGLLMAYCLITLLTSLLSWTTLVLPYKMYLVMLSLTWKSLSSWQVARQHLLKSYIYIYIYIYICVCVCMCVCMCV